MNKRTVFSLHGIRTRGAWQKELTKALSEAGFIHIPLDYGRFSAFRLLVPWLRRKQIEWFRDKYSDHVDAYPPCIIAHSFGTYLVARSMEIHSEISFEKIILCGSIIRKEYPWSKRVAEGQCHAVLHDFGHMDIWARIAQYIVEDAGPSGAKGFIDEANGKVVQRHHREFRHSDYFYDLNYEKNWIPFLQGKEPQSLTSDDRPPINWKYQFTRALAILLLIVLIYSVWITWQWFSQTPSIEPSPVAQFPEDFINYIPKKEIVMALPPIPKERVMFTYRNETNDDLRLLLFSCYLYYNPENPSRTPWSERELPARSERTITRFNKPSGWFLFYVRKKNTTKWHYLDAYDLFSYERPLLTISQQNGSKGYQLGFSNISE